MDTEKPLITIGITCYNAENSILDAINSAIAQTWSNKEIIIVDDCSNDRSVSVIKNILASHNNITFIKNDKNIGASASRQKIIDNAKGEFVAFFDDDDISLPDRIYTQLHKIISFEENTGNTMLACYASGYRVYDNGYKKELNAIGSQEIIPYGKDMAGYILFFKRNNGWFYGNGTPSCSLMARKSVFIKAGGFDPSFRRVEDLDFAVRLALAKGYFIGCSERLFIQKSTQSSDKSYERNLESEIILAKKYKEYLISERQYEYSINWPKVRYYHFKQEYIRMIILLIRLFFLSPIQVTRHLLISVPRRFLHEKKINENKV